MGLYNVKFRYSNFKIIINYNLYDVEIEEFPRNTILSDLEQGIYVGIIQIKISIWVPFYTYGY